MKKWLFLVLMILAIPQVAKAEFEGIFGQLYSPLDTVGLYLSCHDSTGLRVKDMDTIVVVRYFRGVKFDSLKSAGTRGADHAQVDALGESGSGRYYIKFRASIDGLVKTGEDSLGQIAVYIRVAYNANTSSKEFTYRVVRGNGWDALYDLQYFLGADKYTYRVLYPPSGVTPKDSVQYYRIADFNGSASLNTGDTLFVATQYFYHHNNQAVLDSSKVIYHYINP